MNTNETEGYVTTREICDKYRVVPSTVASWRKKGLPYTGTGRALRYKLSEVENWFNEREGKI